MTKDIDNNWDGTIGWVPCDYTHGDAIDSVRHGDVYVDFKDAQDCVTSNSYDGVRYVHADGYLYVEPPSASKTFPPLSDR